LRRRRWKPGRCRRWRRRPNASSESLWRFVPARRAEASPPPGGRGEVSSLERVVDGQAFDLLAVLHVLADETGAPCSERGCDDQGVIEAEPVARLDVQRAMIKRC